MAVALAFATVSVVRDAPAQTDDGNGQSSKHAVSSMPATAQKLSEVLGDLDRDTARLQKTLTELADRLQTSHSLAIARGRAYVRLARAGLLPVGGGFAELVDHATRLERLRRAIDRDTADDDRMTKERLAIASRLRELSERKSMMQDERAALERSHVAIVAAEERERAFARAFSSDWEPGTDHTAVYGSGVGPLRAEDLAQGFEGMKGRLPFPLTGRAEIRAARRGSGSGLEMAGGPESIVRAVFPGRVAFADEYADYGRTVIVEHGSNYYSVSANLGSIDVRAGEEVQAGDRLGSLSVTSTTLYFELRHGTESADPAPWFGI